MSKEKVLDFEALALLTRKQARERAELEFKEDHEEFENLSKKEIELYFELESERSVREAQIYSERMNSRVRVAKMLKKAGAEEYNRRYENMHNKVLFVMQCEKYTQHTQGELCAIMDVSARHYRDVREQHKEILDDEIFDDIFEETDIILTHHHTTEANGLKRVIRELLLVGLSGVTEWSNDEATDKQKQAIESAIAGAQFISNSKAWADCNILEWYVSLNPDQRVKAGCKI